MVTKFVLSNEYEDREDRIEFYKDSAGILTIAVSNKKSWTFYELEGYQVGDLLSFLQEEYKRMC